MKTHRKIMFMCVCGQAAQGAMLCPQVGSLSLLKFSMLLPIQNSNMYSQFHLKYKPVNLYLSFLYTLIIMAMPHHP